MKQTNVVELPNQQPEVINRQMCKDAAAVRKIVVKTLRGFQEGQASVSEAVQVSTLSKRVIDLMKIELLAGPRFTFGAASESKDED